MHIQQNPRTYLSIFLDCFQGLTHVKETVEVGLSALKEGKIMSLGLRAGESVSWQISTKNIIKIFS